MGDNACISKTALPPNTLAATTSRDRTRSQSISLLATSFEFGICVHPVRMTDRFKIPVMHHFDERSATWVQGDRLIKLNVDGVVHGAICRKEAGARISGAQCHLGPTHD